MTTDGWIFLVGFRVFDVGLLVVWLIWFFRLRDEGDDPDEDEGGGGGGGPEPSSGGRGPGGGGMRLPLGHWGPGSGRDRDHSPAPHQPRRRGAEPSVPGPLPTRVRRPQAPLHTHRGRA